MNSMCMHFLLCCVSERTKIQWMHYHHITSSNRFIHIKMIWANAVNKNRNQGFQVKCLLQIFYSSLVSSFVRLYYNNIHIEFFFQSFNCFICWKAATSAALLQAISQPSIHSSFSKVAWWIFYVLCLVPLYTVFKLYLKCMNLISNIVLFPVSVEQLWTAAGWLDMMSWSCIHFHDFYLLFKTTDFVGSVPVDIVE